MQRSAKIAALGIALGTTMAIISCNRFNHNHGAENGARKIIQKVSDPSGKWIAIVDEVEYANGLLTSMADRVTLVGPKPKDSDGVLVFSEDAMPDNEKPTVSWVSNRLLITVPANSNILHQEKQVGEVQIEVRKR
jgi:hypothetical protein